MFTLFQTPKWFAGYDLIIDAIVLIIALAISIYSFRIYKVVAEKKFFYFGTAFLLMALGFLSKMVTYLVVYNSETQFIVAKGITAAVGAKGIGVTWRNLLYRSGFFVQMAATLGSLLLLFLLSQGSRDRLKKLHEVSQITLSVYLILLISVISTFKFTIFYLTGMVILSLILMNLYHNYLQKKNKNAKRVVMAFCSLFAAQIFFIFIFLADWFYFFGQMFTVLGFLLIAITYQKINKSVKSISKGDEQ